MKEALQIIYGLLNQLEIKGRNNTVNMQKIYMVLDQLIFEIEKVEKETGDNPIVEDNTKKDE